MHSQIGRQYFGPPSLDTRYPTTIQRIYAPPLTQTVCQGSVEPSINSYREMSDILIYR